MKARIIRMWKQSYRWDMILLDERGQKIQGCVKIYLVNDFADVLKEDETILIRKFGVADQRDKHKIINLDYKINFFKCTDVKPVSGFQGSLYAFQFVPFSNILAANLPAGAITVDVIGRLAWCGDLEIFKFGGKESKRMNLDLQDYDDNVLRCTLWGSYAEQCNSFVASNESTEMVIVIIQHGRFKEWNGARTVQNDMYGTRLFLNEETTEANNLRRRLILKDGASTSHTVLSSQTAYPMRSEFVTKTARKHVDELIDIEKEINCVVVGTIRLVETEFGWFFNACRKCHKKAYSKAEYLEESKVLPPNFIEAPIYSLWCKKCQCMVTSMIPKFKVQFRVQDSTGSVSFVMFDKDVIKLLGVSATDIRERQLKSDVNETFPPELRALHGKHLAFKIIVSKYNIEKKYHVYTVGKVCDDTEVIAELQDVDQVDQQTPEEAEPLAVKLEDSSQLGISSKDDFFVTGDSFPIEADKDCATSPAVKRPIPFALDEKLDDELPTPMPAKKKLSN